MKIEMGESLMLSWLRHAKECKLAQLNWKPSDTWQAHNETDICNLFDLVRQHFPVFKNSKLEQLIKQAEIDVLGLSFEENKPFYYAIDVAYHENGLNYGSNNETIDRISKKLLRSAFILYYYFNVKNGEIIFASPKINATIYDDLNNQIASINSFMNDFGFEYNFRLIANADFSEYVLNPIIEISANVADTSELFMRAFQLSNLCKKESKKSVNKQINELSKNTSFNEFKIGITVKNKLNNLFSNKLLSNEEISRLKEADYCKKVFNLNFPLLIDKNVSRYDKNGYGRYWDIVFDDKYFACSQWYEDQRSKFENWYCSILNDIKY